MGVTECISRLMSLGLSLAKEVGVASLGSSAS